MIFFKQLKTYKSFFILISLIYFAYAIIFIKPSIFQNFSLVDDGEVLIQSTSFLNDCVITFQCSKFVDQTFEFGTNRFRPSYWLINNILYEIFGNKPQLHHNFRILIVGYITVMLLALILLDMRVGRLMTGVGVFLFATNISFSENIIRLGTNEPYQVLFLALFSLTYLNIKKVKSKSYLSNPLVIILLLWTIFIKENNIAILPTVFLSEIKQSNKNYKKALSLLGIPAIIFTFGILITGKITSTISVNIPLYTSNYVTNPVRIIENGFSNIRLLLNSMSPFLKLTVLFSPFFIFNKRFRNSLINEKYYYWFFFSLFFTLILFPWRYVLDRYQLVSIFGLTIVCVSLIDSIIKVVGEKIKLGFKSISQYSFVYNIFSFWIVINLFLRGFPVNLAKTINYQRWFAGFTKFEAEQVKEIAKYNNEKVIINGVYNINNWELLYEVPIHLRYIYNVEPNIELLTSELNEGGYVFSRTSFDSVVDIKDLSGEGYELIDSNTYEIKQIEPVKFSDQFTSKPLQTLLNPPFKDKQFDYYWEIRKLKTL